MSLNTIKLKTAIKAAFSELDKNMEGEEFNKLVDKVLKNINKTRTDYDRFSQDELKEFMKQHIQPIFYDTLAQYLTNAIADFVKSGDVVGIRTEADLQITTPLEAGLDHQHTVHTKVTGNQTGTGKIQ